ncbi:hypothetical protein G7K_2890-t1 [Saitoella complicata NRRL Y-17804]|uniref:Putative peptidase domain-containing protein n=1 Tax=Saitoella complicata (strain BCRC 22490 / CBS 7301 / JCM 7358 / NBRC 10748 / NRRL Y-17804) TaxID=698492 RepID=A0A0E9NH33_SAICN|nr:hypothetical protein G7K_2890-t1 [Saitoella complicata NRRL Y-17804]
MHLLPLLAPLVLASAVLGADHTNHDEHDHSAHAEWYNNGTNDITIHESCNATQATQIGKALDDMKALASHARDRVLRYGSNDTLYQLYFGNGDPASVIGTFSRLVEGDKTDVLFRCDNPDNNCHQEGWAGHWRGSNATSETVICELSYTSRRPLEQFCGFGYSVANSSANFYFGSDLLHRLFHIPKIFEGWVSHFADPWEDCVDLAKVNGTYAVRNQHSLQFFAVDAWGRDIVDEENWEGCPGYELSRIIDVEASGESKSTTTEPVSSAASSATASVTAILAATTTAAAAACHTHADGSVHCD